MELLSKIVLASFEAQLAPIIFLPYTKRYKKRRRKSVDEWSRRETMNGIKGEMIIYWIRSSEHPLSRLKEVAADALLTFNLKDLHFTRL